MVHLLANKPSQQDAGEIFLSGFSHLALQMEAQGRLMKLSPRTRRTKKGPKKQPQRGLGVAQLEKMRLEEQSRASHQAQQLIALRQLHSTHSFLYANEHAPSVSVIPQLERNRSITVNGRMLRHPSTSPALHELLRVEGSPSSVLSNIFSNASTACQSASSACFLLGSDGESLDRPLQLQLGKQSDVFREKNSLLPHLQTDERPDYWNVECSLLPKRCSVSPVTDANEVPGKGNQVHGRNLASPSMGLLDRTVELSSFQSGGGAAILPRDDSLFASEKQVYCVKAQQQQELRSLLSESPKTVIASTAGSKTYWDKCHSLRTPDECELTLRPPETATGNKGCCELLPDGLPFVQSPVSVATTGTTSSIITTTSTMDEYTSTMPTSLACPSSFLSANHYRSNKESQTGLITLYDGNLDLTLKL
ncbi:hypothetical protein KP509_21G042000 [Ceratopteris richardii]|uniref:Uncharacterized protein n=1 Tax=Ceratopteris richardii TaxID=49495 RepID=A0A8T2SB83_CERRI|nr:hypothetical protein KP509_21G042000 [Ceratopteris richardii]